MHMELNSDREVKKDAKKLKSFLLSDQEWELIEKLVSILSHFDTITTTLKEIPPINAEYILNEVESLQENQEPLALHSIEENDQGEHYWSEPSILAMLASALDPRFKHLKFIDNQACLETLNFLKM
ncbi:5823_t:CDS:2, partial [Entrophospora sp. SA101]